MQYTFLQGVMVSLFGGYLQTYIITRDTPTAVMRKKSRKVFISNLSGSVLFFLFVIDIVDQSLRGDDLLHEFRESLAFELGASGTVVDHAAVKVHLHLVPRLNPLSGLRALDDGKSDIDGVAVKYPGKSLRDHAAHSRRLYSDGRMLSGRSAAEILIRHDDIALLHFFHKILVNILHTVRCQLRRI